MARLITKAEKEVKIDTRKADNNAKDVGSRSKGIEVGIERSQNLLSNEQFFLVDNSEEYGHYNYIKEIGMYCRDGNKKPIDDYNHALDEFRYSVNYFYKTYNLNF